jgi:hypothetical protein
MQEKLIADHSQDNKRSNKQPIGAGVRFFLTRLDMRHGSRSAHERKNGRDGCTNNGMGGLSSPHKDVVLQTGEPA